MSGAEDIGLNGHSHWRDVSRRLRGGHCDSDWWEGVPTSTFRNGLEGWQQGCHGGSTGQDVNPAASTITRFVPIGNRTFHLIVAVVLSRMRHASTIFVMVALATMVTAFPHARRQLVNDASLRLGIIVVLNIHWRSIVALTGKAVGLGVPMTINYASSRHRRTRNGAMGLLTAGLAAILSLFDGKVGLEMALSFLPMMAAMLSSLRLRNSSRLASASTVGIDFIIRAVVETSFELSETRHDLLSHNRNNGFVGKGGSGGAGNGESRVGQSCSASRCRSSGRST